MNKKTACLFFIMILSILLTGCWDYRGLNKITVVTGVGLDQEDADGEYQLSLEAVDLSVPIKESGPKAKIVETEGTTIFDAVRNAEKRVANELYFSEAQVLVIGDEAARNNDIDDLLGWFFRDTECRETMAVVISQGVKALDIISTEGIDQAIASNEIRKIVETDQKVTATTAYHELYQVYEMFHEKGVDLVLPAVINTENNGVMVSEVNGIAIFKGKRLAGVLTPDESNAYLYAAGGIKGGLLVFPFHGKKDDTTIEITSSKTKTSFRMEDGKIKIKIKTETQGFLDEHMGLDQDFSKKDIARMEDIAAAKIEHNVSNLIKKIQSEYDSDIFGFGNLIHKRDYKLWKQLEDNWPALFKDIEVEVSSKVHIEDTSTMK